MRLPYRALLLFSIAGLRRNLNQFVLPKSRSRARNESFPGGWFGASFYKSYRVNLFVPNQACAIHRKALTERVASTEQLFHAVPELPNSAA